MERRLRDKQTKGLGGRFSTIPWSGRVFFFLVALWLSGQVFVSLAASPLSTSLARLAEAHINMPLAPPVSGYGTENAFPSLRFQSPLALVTPPGETNRLFVAEKIGRISVITNLANPGSSVFLDITNRVNDVQESGLIGLAFHPGYATNRYFFIVYTEPREDGSQNWRLSRFQCSATNANVALPASEAALISQVDGDPYHEGGNLAFGPDGYLYVSIGDGGGGYSEQGHAQRIDQDFFSGILRLDVDGRPRNLVPNPHPASYGNYLIPADNPFVTATSFDGYPVDPRKVRTEFYAVGLRNPFRFSFDSLTGDLYSNDTGQARREEIDLIVSGGNYGWPFREGTYVYSVANAPTPRESNFIPPIAEYGTDIDGSGPSNIIAGGDAITGGLFCRGTAITNLEGAYIFSDFPQGKLGMIRFANSQPAQQWRDIQGKISQLELRLKTPTIDLSAAQLAWETAWQTADAAWHIVIPGTVTSREGTTLTVLPDYSILASGAEPWDDTYSIVVSTPLSNITAVRLELLPDPSLPNGGPGREGGGGILLSEFSGTTETFPGLGPQPMIFTNAQADFSQDLWNIQQAIDGDPATAWGIYPFVGAAHTAIFELSTPAGSGANSLLTFNLDQLYGYNILIGRFRLSVTASLKPVQLDTVPPFVAEILRLPNASWSVAQRNILAAYYRSIAPSLQSDRDQLQAYYAARESILDQGRATILWMINQQGIASFGMNPANRDVLMTDLLEGVIRRITFDSQPAGQPIPPTLAETGIFTDLVSLTPSPGVIPYDINAPFWSDGANKYRWFSLPGTNSAITFNPDGAWGFPAGTVWAKHFEIETPLGLGSSLRRLETRVLVKSVNGIYGVTYKWDGRVDASLVPEEGLNEDILTRVGGIVRTQTWRYPSRSDCLRCHTAIAGYALGTCTSQMNRPGTLWNSVDNQLLVLSEYGWFDRKITNLNSLHALASLEDSTVSREYRIRSFLQGNCVQCHQPGGAGGGFKVTVAEADLVVSAWLVAFTVTTCWLAMEDGAV